ncbi:MAG: RsmE family RNA methyltransferase [Cyanobacteria bacterium J06638_7]
MAREWRRLLVPPERLAAAAADQGAKAHLSLAPSELHYLRRVLRLRPGQRFALVDGAGHLWSATLAAAPEADRAGEASLRALLEQPLGRPLQSEPAAAVVLELAVALPRQGADVLLRMACELGMDRLTPLLAARSAAEPLKPQRQSAILRESLEQCERLWLPVLDPPTAAAAALAAPAAAAGGSLLRLLATTRRQDLPSLEQRLRQHLPSAAVRGGDGVSAAADQPALEETSCRVCVAIGPEGGWSEAEEQTAEAAGWQPVGLGATILRTSTAAVTAAALLAAWRRGLGVSCGTSRPPSP